MYSKHRMPSVDAYMFVTVYLNLLVKIWGSMCSKNMAKLEAATQLMHRLLEILVFAKASNKAVAAMMTNGEAYEYARRPKEVCCNTMAKTVVGTLKNK